MCVVTETIGHHAVFAYNMKQLCNNLKNNTFYFALNNS